MCAYVIIIACFFSYSLCLLIHQCYVRASTVLTGTYVSLSICSQLFEVSKGFSKKNFELYPCKISTYLSRRYVKFHLYSKAQYGTVMNKDENNSNFFFFFKKIYYRMLSVLRKIYDLHTVCTYSPNNNTVSGSFPAPCDCQKDARTCLSAIH